MITLLIVLLWIILGVFISYKANWYEDNDNYFKEPVIMVTIILAPFVFAWDIFNRMFLQKWHKN